MSSLRRLAIGTALLLTFVVAGCSSDAIPSRAKRLWNGVRTRIARRMAPAPIPDTGAVVMTIVPRDTFTISRFIYGANFVEPMSWGGATEFPPFTVHRIGGNRLSAYNWENNASNAGSDYKNQNDGLLSPSALPGAAITERIDGAFRHGAGAVVTVPMLSHVAADRNGPTGTDDATLVSRLATRFVKNVPSAGWPIAAGGPNAGDGVVAQDAFIAFLDGRYRGAFADATRPIFVSLDNEPDGWSLTHQELRPPTADGTPRLLTYDEFTATSIDFADAVKRAAPGARIFGPATATWAGIATLGRTPTPDPVHGTDFFLANYLDRFREAESARGHRLLDVLDVHWYPENGTTGGRITNDWAPQTDSMISARLQAPRSLWDSTYDERSWVTGTIGGPVALIPRLRGLVAQHYPGTKIAITEYYFGRGGDISGGLAQADVLGAFGREGLFAAMLWPNAGVGAPPYNGRGAAAYAYVFGAFDLFVNYDGHGARFGDIGVRATTNAPTRTAVYASRDTAGRLVLVVINRTASVLPARIGVGRDAGVTTARPYVLSAAAPRPMVGEALRIGGDGVLSFAMPAMSATTLVLGR